MHAELFQPVTTSVPAIRTLSVDGKQGFGGAYGQRTLGAHRSEALEDSDLLHSTGQALLLLLLEPCMEQCPSEQGCGRH